jgi:YesN/AraC family two-component response regulator
LFVDDEPRILDGLRRMLRGMRGEWDMHFAARGAAALDLLGQRPFEVLITDMRMPGMTGGELLVKVKQLHPDVVRTGQSSGKMSGIA